MTGKHTLTVIAVNTNNKTTTKTQEVDGVDESTKPTVGAAIDSADRSKIIFSASDESGLKNLSFTINGQKYELPASTEGQKELQYTFQVKEGKWIGAKVGTFCTRPNIKSNDGGWVDGDWFRITK